MKTDLKDKIVVITGGGGLLGSRYATAIAECKGIPILADIDEKNTIKKGREIENKYNLSSLAYKLDITSINEIKDFTYRIFIFLNFYEKLNYFI